MLDKMITKRKKINGVYIDNLSIEDALDNISLLLQKSCFAQINFINLDCLRISEIDDDYRNILNQSELNLPDGIGLDVIFRLNKQRLNDNCNGTDLTPKILKLANQLGKSIYFLGSQPGISSKAHLKANIEFRSDFSKGYHHGYFENNELLLEEILDSNADLIITGMGVPLQEKWIHNNKEHLTGKVCIAVGAFIDFYTDSIPRAPQMMRKLRLEWIWRIVVEPKRMFKRYILDDIPYLLRVLLKREK